MAVPATTDTRVREQWMLKGQECYLKMAQASLNHLANLYGQGTGAGWVAKRAASKCPSCGSREFRHHNMIRICSYCRSEA